jgi:mannose-6-phosphate isomerase-like protein (cupin superfamily)
MTAPPPAVSVLREGVPLDIVDGAGSAVAIAWPGVGSEFRAMHRLELDAGAATIPLRHEGEAVYFVVQGRGRAGGVAVQPRSLFYVPRRSAYRIEADKPMVVYGGPCPPDRSLYGDGERLAADGDPGEPVQVYEAASDGVPLPMIGRRVRLVVWPGMGAEVAAMVFAPLDAGEENLPHTHVASDDVIAVLEGEGTIDDITNDREHSFRAGDVIFVPAGVEHKVRASKGVPIVSVGGPCPPDIPMLRALGLV